MHNSCLNPGLYKNQKAIKKIIRVISEVWIWTLYLTVLLYHSKNTDLKYDAQWCTSYWWGEVGTDCPGKYVLKILDTLYPLIVCTTLDICPPWFAEVMVLRLWRRISLSLVINHMLYMAAFGVKCWDFCSFQLVQEISIYRENMANVHNWWI